MKHRSLILTLLLIFLAALACREKPEEKKETWLGTPADTSGTAAATADATHPASPGGTAVVPDVSAGTTVLVVLNDNSIALPGQPIPPGPAVLTIENGGTETHNLYVEGEGINRAAGDNLVPNATTSVDVLFKPGTYVFYCPIADHRQKGEQVQVTIAAP